jgi:signal transduction histidine kinase
MKIFRHIVNPVFTFIGLQLLWILVLVGWIYWFMGKHQQFRSLAEKYSPELLQGSLDWLILVEGILLLVAILAGVYVIFIFWRRQNSLNRAQRNFIAQVTHELKSPIASIRLHLETIRRHQPNPENLAGFVDIMLADTQRLDILTSNLLTVNRIEHKGFKLALKPADYSALVENYFRDLRYSLPRAGSMELAIEPDLRCRLESESLETVFRNLLENSLLYSDASPEIRIELYRDGQFAHLTFGDKGRGIDPRDQKKVFNMFYRVRKAGKTIRGSGLGLFIVMVIVRLHKGKVWLESAGSNHGTTVHILLPLWTGPLKKEKP